MRHIDFMVGDGTSYAHVTRLAIAVWEVAHGRLARFAVLSPAYGGSTMAMNQFHAPVRTGLALAAIDDEAVAHVRDRRPLCIEAHVDRGDDPCCLVPRRVTYTLGPLGTRTLHLW